MDLQENFISDWGSLTINVHGRDRRIVTTLLEPNPRSDDQAGLLADYKQRLTAAQQNVKSAASKFKEDDPQSHAVLGLARQELEQIENEHFSTEPQVRVVSGGLPRLDEEFTGETEETSENHQVAEALCRLIPAMELNCGNIMDRFKNSLD